MAKAYKITSDPFFVNASLTESAPGVYTSEQVSLPLDSLNREGVLVHAVYFTSTTPDNVAGNLTKCQVQVTSTLKTGMVGANDANLIASRSVFINGGAAEFSGPHIEDFIGSQAPYQESDNLMIVATDDVFFGILGVNNVAPMTGECRLVCSRIKLEAAAYAALVTNELSS